MRVIHRLQKAGFMAYPVGGGVRDLLIGRKVMDWDVTTDATPAEVLPLFSHVVPTGIEHGTVTVFQGKKGIEVTTFRGEVGYQDGRHPDRVIFLDSLEEDLKRRDFTVNAMALDVEKNRVIDPFEGRADLKKGILRAVGSPKLRFSEDGLRPLRAVRFACVLQFEIHKETFLAIRDSIDVFRKVAAERVREELLKILASPHAASGIELLRSSGLLEVIIPEMIPMVGFPQNSFHKHDVYAHSLKSLAHAQGDAVLKLAVMLHDVGKPRTAGGTPGEHTFYGHEKVSAELADLFLERFRFSKEERRRVSILIQHHMFHYTPDWTDGAVRRLVQRVSKERLTDLWEMRRADIRGRGTEVKSSLDQLRRLEKRVRKLLTKDAALKVTDLAIGGEDIMSELKIAPGPRIGALLEAILERVLDDPTLNSKEKLIALTKEIAQSI
jgi:tRNA nucleotidyltransferase (CCA-adding enzyme)